MAANRDLRDRRRPPRVAAIAGGATAAAVYVAVAPTSCDADGWCHGLVAFDYAPASWGHWQAVTAGAIAGGGAAFLAWLAASPPRVLPALFRAVVSVPLVLGAIVSLMSQSVLIVLGPLAAVVVLWLLWRAE